MRGVNDNINARRRRGEVRRIFQARVKVINRAAGVVAEHAQFHFDFGCLRHGIRLFAVNLFPCRAFLASSDFKFGQGFRAEGHQRGNVFNARRLVLNADFVVVRNAVSHDRRLAAERSRKFDALKSLLALPSDVCKVLAAVDDNKACLVLEQETVLEILVAEPHRHETRPKLTDLKLIAFGVAQRPNGAFLLNCRHLNRPP